MRKYLEACEVRPGDSYMPHGGKHRVTVLTGPEPYVSPQGRHLVRFRAQANGETGDLAYVPDSVVGLVTREG